MVYLQDDSKYLSGRQRIRAGLDAGIRMYTAREISLRQKNPFSVSDIETNGETAFATVGSKRLLDRASGWYDESSYRHAKDQSRTDP